MTPSELISELRSLGQQDETVLFQTKQEGISGPRNNGKGDKWFQDGAARHGSKSDSRKAASAQIAKIPYALASYIACSFLPKVGKCA